MNKIKNKLSDKGLKITPQRLIILEAIYSLNHPNADDVIKYVSQKHPNIAIGTVYKVLDKFVETGLIKRITTERDVIRYDGLTISHHHLHSTSSQRVEDYIDPELDKLLQKYFLKKKIDNFNIEEISLQMKGKFNNQ